MDVFILCSGVRGVKQELFHDQFSDIDTFVQYVITLSIAYHLHRALHSALRPDNITILDTMSSSRVENYMSQRLSSYFTVPFNGYDHFYCAIVLITIFQ